MGEMADFTNDSQPDDFWVIGDHANPALRRIRMDCKHCGKRAEFVTGKEVYPHRPDLHDKKFYCCVPCDARVGCHPGTTTPLGELATKDERAARMAAHEAFDRLWKSGEYKRGEAYDLLARKLGVRPGMAHIGSSDVETCKKIIAIAKSMMG